MNRSRISEIAWIVCSALCAGCLGDNRFDLPADGGTASEAPVRLLAPLSGSTTVSHRPMLRFQAMSATESFRVEICDRRDCSATVSTIDASTGRTAQPGTDLAPGMYFWRVRSFDASNQVVHASAVWEFRVPARALPTGDGAYGTNSDFDGDGIDDLAIASQQMGTGSTTGRVSLYLGLSSGPDTQSAGSVSGAPGEAMFGVAVAAAGDLNGDGFVDLAVADPDADGGRGQVSVYLTSAGRWPAAPDVVLAAPTGASAFGSAIASAGDVNGDGYTDLLVGAPNGGDGFAYVFFGSASGPASTPGITLAPTSIGPRIGSSVAGGADFDGDGNPDVVVGSAGAHGTGASAVYTGTGAGLSATPGFTLGSGGIAVQFIGDVDRDGTIDIATGAPGDGSTPGQVLVYHGRSGARGQLLTADQVLSDTAVGNKIGASIAAGDFDGDGNIDLISGVLGGGALVLASGSTSGDFGTPGVLTIPGGEPMNGLGAALVAGRFTADEIDDFAVSAPAGNRVFFAKGTSGGALTWTTLAPDGTSFGRALALRAEPLRHADVHAGASVRTTRLPRIHHCSAPGIRRPHSSAHP